MKTFCLEGVVTGQLADQTYQKVNNKCQDLGDLFTKRTKCFFFSSHSPNSVIKAICYGCYLSALLSLIQ